MKLFTDKLYIKIRQLDKDFTPAVVQILIDESETWLSK